MLTFLNIAAKSPPKEADVRGMSSNGDDPRQGPKSQAERRAPRQKVPSSLAPSPEGTYITVDRLATLMNQMGDMLSSSMENLTNAASCIAKHSTQLGDAACRQIQDEITSASTNIEKVAEMVHGAMQSRSLALGSPLLSKARPISVREAVDHAVDVLRPAIDRHDIDVKVQIPDDVGATPAGALYTVILNAMQNAVEAIERRRGPGAITVTVRREQPPRTGGYGKDTREWQTIEIIDDGEGPPQTHDSSRVFDLGFTTKPRGTGVGLAVARSVIQSMGGTIELHPCYDKAPAGKKGAVLRARYPAPDAFLNIRLGGAA
jgi:signal transduction histidine kinase